MDMHFTQWDEDKYMERSKSLLVYVLVQVDGIYGEFPPVAIAVFESGRM
jgi:hypothetical protein